MFSSSGYFRGVNCPYFGSGLCERSYCHFRHVKQDEKPKQSAASHLPAQKEETVSKPQTKPEDAPATAGQGSLLNLMGNAIKQVQRDIEKDKAQLYNLKHSQRESPPVTNAVPLYKPTPIAAKTNSVQKPKKQSPPKKTYLPIGIPAYKPTPISELRKKNVKSQNEYDPLANFSTCTGLALQTPNERITLGDAEKNTGGVKRQSSSEEYIPVKRSKTDHKKSSEEEIEAKFSEEEDDIEKCSDEEQKESNNVAKSHLEDDEDKNHNKQTAKQSVNTTSKRRGSEECGNLGICADKSDSLDADPKNADKCADLKVKETSSVVTVTEEKLPATINPKVEDQKDGKDSDSKSQSTCDKDDETLQKETGKEKLPVTDQNSNNGEKGKSNDTENEKKTRHHSGHKHDKDHKEKTTSHRSRNDRKSKEIDKKHANKDQSKDRHERSSRKKHSSSSSQNRHKNHSSSPHARKSSSSRHSHSRSRKQKESHKHKKNKHRSRSDSRSHRHKDKKDSDRDQHSHRSRSDRRRDRSHRDSSSKSRRSTEHRSRHSRRHSSASKSSPHSKRRHKRSYHTSDSSSSSSSERSSRSSSPLSLSITPSSSRASSQSKDEQSANKTSQSSRRNCSTVKSSPRSGSTKHGDHDIHKSGLPKCDTKPRSDVLLSSNVKIEKDSVTKMPVMKSPARMLSPTGPTLFEKFQRAVSHVDLFGDDSDNDSKGINSSKYKNGSKITGVKVKQEPEDSEDDNVIVLSDEELSEGEYRSDEKSKASKDNKTYGNSLKNHRAIKREVSTDDPGRPGEGPVPKKKLVAEEFIHERETTTMKKEELNMEDQHDQGESGFGPKKRTAHIANPDAIKRSAPSKKAPRLTPAQVMLKRYQELQTSQPETETSSRSMSETPSASESSSGKQRVAHHPKAPESKPGHTLLKRKPGRSGTTSAEGHTVSTTVGKDGKRVAHVPAKALLKRPLIRSEVGAKLPTNIRQRYLNKLVDECLNLYPEEKDAYERALEEEKAVYDRATNKNIYLNVAINAIKKLRDESSKPDTNGDQTVKSPTKNPKALSHAMMLGGAKALTTGYTMNRSGGPVKLPNKFSGPDLYKLMARYILTEEQLTANGFPAPSDKPREALLKIPDRYKHMSKDINEKQCCRCGKKFIVYPEGQYARQESCTYHWGKCFKRRVAGSIDNRFTCCDGDVDTPGCQISKYHVHDQNRYQDFKNYRTILPSTPPDDGDNGVYAMDCEMVYTSAGSELARVTVIDQDLRSVYEALVRPEHPILDYNTRFSGLTDESMEGVTTTIRDVQKSLMNMFNSQTILIGHSLESDFIALKLIHKTVVDTSVVFPHRLGPPLKRALKNLMADKLQKIIQNDAGGHDSKEDAVSCMELMLWQIKQDARKISRS